MLRLPRFLRRSAPDPLLGVPHARISPEAPWAERPHMRVTDQPAVIVEREVYERFLAYAQAAWPNEIGGMLRCEPTDDGGVHITDLIILPQRVSRVTFDLDEAALAQFIMNLARTGRAAEIREWSSLIHSHPAMPPFLSGRDRANIIRLAGERHAWSLICSVWPDADENYCAMHYHQAGPVPMTITHFPVEILGEPWTPSATEIEAVRAEVAALATSGTAAAWDRSTGRDAWQDDDTADAWDDEESAWNGPESEWEESPEDEGPRTSEDPEWEDNERVDSNPEWEDDERADTNPEWQDPAGRWSDDLWQELDIKEPRR